MAMPHARYSLLINRCIMRRGQILILNNEPQPKCDFFCRTRKKQGRRPPKYPQRPLAYFMGDTRDCYLTPLASRLLEAARHSPLLKTALGFVLFQASNDVHEHVRECLYTCLSLTHALAVARLARCTTSWW